MSMGPVNPTIPGATKAIGIRWPDVDCAAMLLGQAGLNDAASTKWPRYSGLRREGASASLRSFLRDRNDGSVAVNASLLLVLATHHAK